MPLAQPGRNLHGRARCQHINHRRKEHKERKHEVDGCQCRLAEEIADEHAVDHRVQCHRAHADGRGQRTAHDEFFDWQPGKITTILHNTPPFTDHWSIKA